MDTQSSSHQSKYSELSLPHSNNSSSGENFNDPGKVIIYFHANAEDLGKCLSLLTRLREILGARIIAMEYPGYGLHGYEAKCSQQLQKDALTVYDFVNQVMKVKEEDIFLLGRSIGSSVATYVA